MCYGEGVDGTYKPFLPRRVLLWLMADDRCYTVSSMKAPWPVRAANSTARGLRRLGLGVMKLDRDKVMRKAQRKTGLKDWGGDDFVPVLDALVENVRERGPEPVGEHVIRFVVLRGLMNRLRIQDHINRHPEVLDIPIERPVFVVGFPRTGTTLLQNVLSMGHDYRALRLWELATPYPLAEDREKDRKKRMRKVSVPLKFIQTAAPGLNEIHDVRAGTKEEDWILMVNTLVVVNADIFTGMHEWNRWLMARDRTWAYREYKRMLQVLAAPGFNDIFVVKCPNHLWNLEPILKTFPDACIVWTHRNPVNSIASYCSLGAMGRRIFYKGVDPAAVGEMVEERFHTGIQDALKVREEYGKDRFTDVNFSDLVKDIPGTVAKIRRHFGLPHDKKSEAEIKRWLNRPRDDKPGRHKYGPEQWCVDPEEVKARFSPYLKRFGLD